MAALFRFPSVTVAADVAQTVAVRNPTTGKFYRVSIQSIIDLAVSGGLPSLSDDGTDVDIDANVAITGTLTVGDLPTVDPEVEGQLWLDTGVLSVSAGPA